MEYTKNIPLKKEKSYYTWAGVIIVILSAVITGGLTNFNIKSAIIAIPGVLDFISSDFLPPSVDALPSLVEPFLDTIYMGVVATFTGALVSLILAFLCAAPTTPHSSLKILIRGFISLLRNIPSLAWALILVPAFGIGPLVGLVALFIGSVGTMTRFFTEAIEEVDQSGIEAVKSVGGSYWQTLKGGVVPQCLPSIVTWTLYNLELNIRASTIIGMVGGGGIGLYIQSTIKLFRYDYAAMAIMIVAVFVILLEFLSKKVRSIIL